MINEGKKSFTYFPEGIYVIEKPVSQGKNTICPMPFRKVDSCKMPNVFIKIRFINNAYTLNYS